MLQEGDVIQVGYQGGDDQDAGERVIGLAVPQDYCVELEHLKWAQHLVDKKGELRTYRHLDYVSAELLEELQALVLGVDLQAVTR